MLKVFTNHAMCLCKDITASINLSGRKFHLKWDLKSKVEKVEF